MSLEKNKALARRFWEVHNSGDLAALDDFVAHDYIQHQGDVAPGREGLRQFLVRMAGAFPDQHGSIQQILSEGDTVLTRTIVTGTHIGQLRDIAPTNRKISVEVIDMWRVADGMLAEHWGVFDRLDFMQQLGVLPSHS